MKRYVLINLRSEPFTLGDSPVSADQSGVTVVEVTADPSPDEFTNAELRAQLSDSYAMCDGHVDARDRDRAEAEVELLTGKVMVLTARRDSLERENGTLIARCGHKTKALVEALQERDFLRAELKDSADTTRRAMDESERLRNANRRILAERAELWDRVERQQAIVKAILDAR